MIDKMDIEAYLRRINYQGSSEPTFDTLRALHRAHMLNVPFENLDISLGRRIVLDEAYLYDKIVKHQRGGFCYELNGLFSALLREMGFKVQRFSARVADGNGGYGMEFDHMTLLVQLEERWLADVGFGDSFHEPLRLDEHGSQVQERGTYRISDEGPHLAMLRKEDSLWKAQYIFTLQPYELSDFSEACLFHQTSPESHFTQGRICSRSIPEGRITLRNMRLINTTNDRRTERKWALVTRQNTRAIWPNCEVNSMVQHSKQPGLKVA
jgi:N-hydroxyarylamine O-acetyltransferase